MDNLNVPRYRTINGCLNEIKELDPQTAITEWFIRNLCKQNKITYFTSGNKTLVNLSDLLIYLDYSEQKQNIRRDDNE